MMSPVVSSSGPVSPASPIRFGVVAPTFNNAGTLAGVLRGLAAHGLPVIVVNDGSTDATAVILAKWCGVQEAGRTDRIIVTHPHNRGKADALRSGFACALAHGLTHAVTIDTDGQLDPAQLPRLLAETRTDPGALVLGWRDATADDYPRASRWGRRWSNRVLRWESGARVIDSQCGYRVYPLALADGLGLRGGRYEYETEWIVRAAWAGVAIRQVEVSCRYDMETEGVGGAGVEKELSVQRSSSVAGEELSQASSGAGAEVGVGRAGENFRGRSRGGNFRGRVSHFRKGGDTWRAVRMHGRLMGRSVLPWPFTPRLCDAPTGTIAVRLWRWVSPARAWRQVRGDAGARRRFAGGLALGVLIANLPLYGVQTALSLVCARWFRLHPLPVVTGAHLSTPPIGPVLIVAAIAVGHRVLHGGWPVAGGFDPQAGYVTLIATVLLEWIVGGLLIGVVLATITFTITSLVLALLPPPPPTPPPAPRKLPPRDRRGAAAPPRISPGS